MQRIKIIQSIEKSIKSNLDYDNFCNIIDYIMLCYYISWIKDESIDSTYYFNMAKKHLNYIIKNIKKYNVLPGNLYGFSTLLYLCNVLAINDEYVMFINKIINFLERYIYRFYMINLYNNELKTSVYDLLNGLSGVGIALYNNGYRGNALKSITRYIINIQKKTKFVIKNKNITNSYFYYNFKKGYIDLGTAHGIISCYVFLKKIKKIGINIIGLNEVIDDIFELYFDVIKISSENKGYLPQCIIMDSHRYEEQYFFDDRLSWCYGCLNIYRIFLMYADEIKCNIEFFSDKINYLLSKNSIDNFNLICPTFCHGLSGLYYTVSELQKYNISYLNNDFLNIFKNNIEEMIWKSINKNYKYYFCKIDYSKVSKKYIFNESNIGYLSGIVSIIIPFISSNYTIPKNKNIFNKILLF